MNHFDAKAISRWGLATCLLFGAPMAGTAGTIVGSRHDLSTASSPEVCVWCHTPHFANTHTGGPLWNRGLPSSGSFTPYSSSTMDTSPGAPRPVSLLCLGCHDGVSAADQSGAGINNTKHDLAYYHGSPDVLSYPNCERCHVDLYSGGERVLVLGTDLSNDHPISMPYPTAAQDPDFNTPPDPQDGWGEGHVRLVDGYVECVSCHDVHDPTNDPFLNESNAASNLCLVCHNK